MQTISIESEASRVPSWLLAASILGTAWNVFGIYQYTGTLTESGRAAMTAGMTVDQAALYLSLPVWISVVFAFGVFGGLMGSILLGMRRRVSRLVLGVSLIGYALLFSGDTYYGVFATIPSQIGILALVVVIAATLYGLSELAVKRGLLN